MSTEHVQRGDLDRRAEKSSVRLVGTCISHAVVTLWELDRMTEHCCTVRLQARRPYNVPVKAAVWYDSIMARAYEDQKVWTLCLAIVCVRGRSHYARIRTAPLCTPCERAITKNWQDAVKEHKEIRRRERLLHYNLEPYKFVFRTNYSVNIY